MALDNAREVARLYKRKADLEEQIKEVKRDLDAALQKAGDELIEEGLPRLAIKGVIIHFKTVASVKIRDGRDGPPLEGRQQLSSEDNGKLMGAMKRMGLSAFVKTAVNKNSLIAYIRNMIEAQEKLPRALKHWMVIEASHVPHVMMDSAETKSKPVKRQTSAAITEQLGEEAIL